MNNLNLTLNHCAILREAIKPLCKDTSMGPEARESFCIRLYEIYHALEKDPDVLSLPFPLNQNDILLINQHVSMADGGEAIDILAQCRAVLYELKTGVPSIMLASSKDVGEVMEAEVRPKADIPGDGK